ASSSSLGAPLGPTLAAPLSTLSGPSSDGSFAASWLWDYSGLSLPSDLSSHELQLLSDINPLIKFHHASHNTLTTSTSNFLARSSSHSNFGPPSQSNTDSISRFIPPSNSSSAANSIIGRPSFGAGGALAF